MRHRPPVPLVTPGRPASTWRSHQTVDWATSSTTSMGAPSLTNRGEVGLALNQTASRVARCTLAAGS